MNSPFCLASRKTSSPFLLNLKRLRVRLSTDEPQVLTLSAKGIKNITAKAIEHPGQVEILNPELHIADLTDKAAELDMEITVEKGLGYVSKEVLHKDRVDVGAIALDASFSPIKKVIMKSRTCASATAPTSTACAFPSRPTVP